MKKEEKTLSVTERRRAILEFLEKSDGPVAAKEFAARFGVSRQVIVQDFAVIRASLPNIISTARGYIMQQSAAHAREFKVRHSETDAEKELTIIVDGGGEVKNVSISHRIYGRIVADLDIKSRQDVKEFLEKLSDAKSTLLSSATSGYHYHLVEAASEERLDGIERQLGAAGILAPLSEWEQMLMEHEKGRTS